MAGQSSLERFKLHYERVEDQRYRVWAEAIKQLMKKKRGKR